MVPSYARKNNSCKEKFSPTSQRDVGENQSVKEHSVKLSRNGIIYATVEKTSKKAEKVRAIPAPCC